MKIHGKYILFFTFFCIILTVDAQNTENPFLVEFTGTTINLQEPFTISVKITGFDQAPLVTFPDNIKNFQKRESSRSSLTNKIGGNTLVTYTISQNYYPLKAGTFDTGPIEILVNKQVLRSEGTEVVVEASKVENEEEEMDVASQITPEMQSEAAQGAFLVVAVDKRRVYVQEGFNLRLSLLVSENNATDMEFYEVEKQLEKVLKSLKPASCWEENFGIQEIPTIPVEIGGKRFMEYRIYQASFFPLNNQTIQIPTVSWTMKTVKENASGEEVAALQTFTSKPLSINVLNLPPHPLRNQVIVGDFRLEEKISNYSLETGKSYQYDFRIKGTGNIQAIREPTFSNNSLFDIYSPDIINNVLRQKGKIAGEKIFSYQIIPKQHGEFDLNNLVFWVYFNPKKQSYDTLHSNLKLVITGEDMMTTQLATSEAESIYMGIEQWDSAIAVVNYQMIIRNIANILVVLMLIGMIYIFKK
jgi:hypothetical protein